MFLYSGDHDPVGGMGKGVTQVFGWLADAGVEHLKMKLYRDGRHEMHNELNRAEVYRDILSFLRMAGRAEAKQK